MRTIVIANEKGGIGKTTTATSIASILTKKGYKTLLIDADQQGNSTDTYRAIVNEQATLYDVLLDDERIQLAEAIQETSNGMIVASDPLLRKGDEILKNDIEGIYRMQDALEELEQSDKFDYVIIDTAPTMNSILHSCLIAAKEVIIPLSADRYALQGLSQISNTIKAIKKRQNKNLKITGILLVKNNPRTLLSKDVTEQLKTIAEQLDTKLFDTYIRDTVKVSEAQSIRKTLIEYDESCTAAQDYIKLVDEIVKG